MPTVDEKISELRVAQGQTHTLLEAVADKVDSYIQSDDERHRELMEFRVESSRHLAEVAAIVGDLKKDVNRARDDQIPSLQKKQAETDGVLKTHSWLIKAVVTATIMVVLSGLVTTLLTCEPQAEASAEESVVVVGVDGDSE